MCSDKVDFAVKKNKVNSKSSKGLPLDFIKRELGIMILFADDYDISSPVQ